MTGPEGLILQARHLASALDADELVDTELVEQVARDASGVAPHLAPGDLRRLHEALLRLVEAASQHRDRLSQTLGQLPRAARAAQGYGHLRSHTRGQRLVTKA